MTPEAFLELAAQGADSGGKRWALQERTTVGRSPDADIVLALDQVSREHAVVERRPSGFWITDLDSRNGTFVEGVALGVEGVRLNEGDEVVLGGAVTLRFVDAMATPMAPSIGRLHGLWIDPETSAVWIDAQRVEPPLSDRQLRLLKLLYVASGEIVSRPDVVADVWSDVAADGVSDEAVSALVKRTRARLAEYESGTRHIEIIRTRGLRFVNPG